MANSEALVVMSYEASADLSASQYRFMELDSNGRIALVNGAGDNSVGLLQDKPSALGAAGGVAILGRSKAVAGAAVAINAKVSSDASGRAITAVTTHHVLGLALTAAANAGELIEVELSGGHPVLA